MQSCTQAECTESCEQRLGSKGATDEICCRLLCCKYYDTSWSLLVMRPNTGAAGRDLEIAFDTASSQTS